MSTRNNQYEYEIVKSRGRRMSISINAYGKIFVHVPTGTSQRTVEKFITQKSDWIEKTLRKIEKKSSDLPPLDPLSQEDLELLKKKARRLIPERVAIYAEKIGVSYDRISIRVQKTRWGSCTQGGNLNFNALLMLTPIEVIDSVVVHELCHRKQMNHSAAFYEEVHKVYPDYDKHHAWLTENASSIYARLPGKWQ